MRKVKKHIAMNLFHALQEANFADVDATEENANDLDHTNAYHGNLFGSLEKAIHQLGYAKQYKNYVENGEFPTIKDL